MTLALLPSVLSLPCPHQEPTIALLKPFNQTPKCLPTSGIIVMMSIWYLWGPFKATSFYSWLLLTHKHKLDKYVFHFEISLYQKFQ